MQHPARDVGTPFERMVSVGKHLGFHDRDDSRLLAQCGIARERVRVRLDRAARRRIGGDPKDGAPLCERRAHRPVLDKALPQPVEAFGDRLLRSERQRAGTGIHLDPDRDAARTQRVDEPDAALRALPYRLVVEDHSADELPDPGGRNQQFPVRAALLFGRLDAELRETRVARAVRFIDREYPTTGANEVAGDGPKITLHVLPSKR